ncbi:Acyl-CoA dehydrogenase [Actinosynnema pretiosum]|nr:Acyl-CoA dehydrogenase [Actinosynnema pretiosum]
MLRDVYRGSVRWDLLADFPEQDPVDRAIGDEVVARTEELLRELVDPDEVDATGALPDGLLEELRGNGLLGVSADPALGGLGLSRLNTCRVVQAAASWSMPVAFSLAINNGFGSHTYLPALPPGPLRDVIAERAVGGVISAGADAEVAGAANERRTTVATPVDGGHRITGEKVFIGNGAVAELLDVSATVTAPDGSESVRLFFVDTRSPGFAVVGRHEFMGLRGSTIAALRFDGVFVPEANAMPALSDGWRMRPSGDVAGPGELADLGELALFGRHLVVAPASLAVASAARRWADEFAARRRIDGRVLGEYEEVRRLRAELAAEEYLAESTHLWCLLGSARSDTRPDLTAAKNTTSLAAWRAIDRTMALYGAEGYETARGKAARGAPAVPVERCFRDARALRVAGGVDFMLDIWSAKANLGVDAAADGGAAPGADGRFVAERVAELGAWCREAAAGDLGERQRWVGLLGRGARELHGAACAVARAAGRDDGVAHAAVTSVRHRIAALWSELESEREA